MPALDEPRHELNRSDDNRNDPGALDTEYQSVIFHLLWEALDYVDCACDQANFKPLQPFHST